jgi:hypothetical protein
VSTLKPIVLYFNFYGEVSVDDNFEGIRIVQVNDAGVLGAVPETEIEDEWEDEESTSPFVDETAAKWRAIGAGGKILATAQDEDALEEAVRSACGGDLPPFSVERVYSRSEVPFLSE